MPAGSPAFEKFSASLAYSGLSLIKAWWDARVSQTDAKQIRMSCYFTSNAWYLTDDEQECVVLNCVPMVRPVIMQSAGVVRHDKRH